MSKRSRSSGLSKSCLANYRVPNSHPDFIPDSHIGAAIDQCSTDSQQCRYRAPPPYKCSLLSELNVSVIRPPQGGNFVHEDFLGVTRSFDGGSVCFSWALIFWIIVIIFILTIFYNYNYFNMK